MCNNKQLLLATSLLFLAGSANAAYDIKIDDNSKISFGGYIKLDARYVDGNINSITKDYWAGAGNVGDISQFSFRATESRFNTKYVNGDITGFIELDFHGGGGNEIVSNSANPRLRHAFIKYQNILVGQTWSTFVNTSALAEAVDFAGPLVASAFIRQGQVRYTQGNFQVALENPESDKGDPSQDSIPDVIAKYTFKGDWGNISVAGLARQLNTVGGNSESALGYGIAGQIKTVGKDDFRFQLHGGETGRYVGVVAARDLVGEQVEESTSVLVAYRHFWTDDIRSTVFYGNTTTDVADADRTHWGVNIFKNYTPKLSFGFEVGNFDSADQNADSNYAQFSAKYAL
ncbi:DcaP family trimeric outer membrane transporter [Colwelliaceae bacterium 6471]